MTFNVNYIDCVLKALNNARYLKSLGYNWSNVNLLKVAIDIENSISKKQWELNEGIPEVRDEVNMEAYRLACLKCNYLHKYSSIWEMCFFNLIAEYICDNIKQCDNVRPLRVLDIGCGKDSSHFSFMFANIDHEIEYVSIDKESDTYFTAPEYLNQITRNHITCDIFETDMITELMKKYPDDYFDIVLLDIEPHGKETEIYDLIYKYLNKNHIAIFECIAFIDLYGSAIGDKVIEHMETKGILSDYFGVFEINYLTRDIVTIVTKDGQNNPDTNKNTISQYLFNSLHEDYISKINRGYYKKIPISTKELLYTLLKI